MRQMGTDTFFRSGKPLNYVMSDDEKRLSVPICPHFSCVTGLRIFLGRS
jgi:hypothetical protein